VVRFGQLWVYMIHSRPLGRPSNEDSAVQCWMVNHLTLVSCPRPLKEVSALQPRIDNDVTSLRLLRPSSETNALHPSINKVPQRFI
jgi:hypothetical protein